ncbi:MAG: hypothetical protein Q8N53_05505 [Longimicrobiales bacterium]|nr:hypothetical protein [Longimicrobiales bacterium]
MRVVTMLSMAAVVAIGGCGGSDAAPVPNDPVEWLASQANP